MRKQRVYDIQLRMMYSLRDNDDVDDDANSFKYVQYSNDFSKLKPKRHFVFIIHFLYSNIQNLLLFQFTASKLRSTPHLNFLYYLRDRRCRRSIEWHHLVFSIFYDIF